MNRIVVCGALLLAIVALHVSRASAARSAPSRYYGFLVGTSNASPPVCRVLKEPHVVRVNDAMVYVVDDERSHSDGDVFRYGQYWFIYQRGYWYRARSHRGPYTALDVKRVPRAIIGVPRHFWRHHPLDGTQEKRAAARPPAARSRDRELPASAHRAHERKDRNDRPRLLAVDVDSHARHGRARVR